MDLEKNTKILLIPSVPIPSRLIFPADGEVRARKVVNRSNYGHVYKFPSTKNNRMMEIEYGLELDRARLLEVDPFVVWYGEQPFMIEYCDEGMVKKMFPDFLVGRVDGSLTIEEIKPYKKAQSPEFRRRIIFEEKILAQHGYSLEVHTEIEIRSGLRLKNAKKLLDYRRIPVNPLMRENVKYLLRECPLTGSDLIARIPGLSDETLLAMLASGFVVADLTAPLDMRTQFLLKRKERVE